MCIIQVYSDIPDCGEFEYLDEDIWLEPNGSYLLNLHILLKVKKNLSKFQMILHGKLQNPINCSFYNKSWNTDEKIGILFNNTFFEDIRENYYERGYNVLTNNQIKIEDTQATVVKESDVSLRECDTDLIECSGVEVNFNEELVAGNVYAMRIGFYIAPPQSKKIRYFVNQMRYQIHFYTTLSINSHDALKIEHRRNRTIPVNPVNSVIFIIPPPNIEIIKPSITSPYFYEHIWKPLSTDELEKPRVAYRWELDQIRKSSKLFVTEHSNPLSFTFRHYNISHAVGYIALFLAALVYIPTNPIFYMPLFILLYVVFIILFNKTFFRKCK